MFGSSTMQEMRWASLFLRLWLVLILSSSSSQAQATAHFVNPTSLNHSQAAALLQLRTDLGIRSRYWPRDADPCLAWTGVQCEKGQVTGIQLSGLRRTVKRALQPSFALDALRAFPSLRTLNASGFPLPGQLPDWLGGLQKLERLDFTATLLNSSIPSSFGALSNLQMFILAQNNITGGIPSKLADLSNLIVLDLSLNGITGEIPFLVGRFQNLKRLNLSANHLRGQIPSGLGGLTQLQGLDFANNELNGPIPRELGNLSYLRVLHLGYNVLSGSIPPELGNLTSLNDLILSYNSLSGPIPSQLTFCTGLQVLLLNHNSLTGKLPPLGSLRNLSSLSVSFNNLTGILPEELSTLGKIKVFSVSHNSFYGPLPTKIKSLLSVNGFDFSYNFFSGNISGLVHSGALMQENCFSEALNQRPYNVCMEFYSRRGLAFQGTAAFPPSENWHPADRSKPLAALLGGIFGGLGLVLIIVLLVFLARKHLFLESYRSEITISGRLNSQSIANMTSLCLGEKFSYAQLRRATDEFNASNLLKAGHSGDLYTGLLGGVPVVVKKVDVKGLKKDTFLTEMDLFGRASHTRLVPLLGHCLELEEQKFLVYKYMPNGNLAHALQGKASGIPIEDALQSLDWITRLKIAIGAAEGLMYLHHECCPPIVHRDVQASSILLDDKFEVRLGSLSKASIAEGEAHHGVMACLFRRTLDQADPGAPLPTCSYDVYCFGKVLLELVTGKIGSSSSNDTSADAWLEWALPMINIYDKESISKVVDSSLILDEDLLEEVWAMAIVAKSCLNPKPSKRPLMRYILKALENPLKVVRDDTLNGSLRSRNSSHGSWNTAFFGSWRHNLSETIIFPGSLREEHVYKGASKQPDNGGSQGSVRSELSRRRAGSNEIFPEPCDHSLGLDPNISQ